MVIFDKIYLISKDFKVKIDKIHKMSYIICIGILFGDRVLFEMDSEIKRD